MISYNNTCTVLQSQQNLIMIGPTFRIHFWIRAPTMVLLSLDFQSSAFSYYWIWDIRRCRILNYLQQYRCIFCQFTMHFRNTVIHTRNSISGLAELNVTTFQAWAYIAWPNQDIYNMAYHSIGSFNQKFIWHTGILTL